MNREEIKTFLPHREPMLLVDEMHMEGDECVARYHVRGDEFFLQGHFPGKPVVPGVILCEMMGQGSSLLMRDRMDDGHTMAMFAAIRDAHFKHPVLPGDVVETHAHLTHVRGNIVFVEATAYVAGTPCCSATMTVALSSKE